MVPPKPSGGVVYAPRHRGLARGRPAKRRKEEVGATRALTKGAELLIQK